MAFFKKLAVLKEAWGFMTAYKKYWLAPILVMLLLFGILIVVAESSAFAPFIYTVF